MAEPQAEVETDDLKPDELEKIDKLEPESTDEDASEKEEAEKPPPGVQITRESKGSLPKGENLGVRRRVNKLKGIAEDAKQREDDANSKLEMEKKKNEILQLRIDQGGSNLKPNPDNYDGGSYDPAFEKDTANFNIKEEVSKQVAESTKDIRERQEDERQSSSLRRKQDTYYDQADELEVSDFGDTETKALDVLGLEATNAIINNFTKDSHYLVYYFGKNKQEADNFRHLWETDKIQAIAEIGGILAELKVSPKTATDTQPAPDEELEGGSASKVEMLQRKYDKLLEKKMKNPGDNSIYPKMIQLRKEMAKAG